nr:immunoglobulin light chain junction region [Macaca mulatta]MOV62284.1 immunoglobulin light chain junction region [Macaca mulatta]MOV64385.1 immunoglobulin light chain junction region [Macaca mulatta]MOV65445.1 immunoglobulin light chain junction region [Macaca mulatta]
CYQYYSGCTF